MTDVLQKQVFGTAQTVISTSTDIAAGNFSGSPAAEYDNNSDALVPYANKAVAVLQTPDWSAAPVADTVCELWGILKDVDGSSDDTHPPSGTSPGGARYFGAFKIAAADALQRRTINISLEGVQNGVDFYVRNGTAENMNNDAGTSCVVKITPYVDAVTI